MQQHYIGHSGQGGGGEVTIKVTNLVGTQRVHRSTIILLLRRLLYMTSDAGILTCADAGTGEQLWANGCACLFLMPPAAADGKSTLSVKTV